MKLAHKLTIGFLAFALLIWITGLIMINVSKQALKDTYTENVTYFSREILKDAEREVSSKVDIFREYSRNSTLKDALLKSNEEHSRAGDALKYLSKRDSLWRSLKEPAAQTFRNAILRNDISRQLSEKTAYYAKRYGHELINSVVVTNKYGALVGQTDKTSEFRHDTNKWWLDVRSQGSQVKLHDRADQGTIDSFDIGIRIDDHSGNFIGAMRVIMSMQEVIEIVKGMQAAYDVKHPKQHEDHDHVHNYDEMEIQLITRAGQMIYTNAKPHDHGEGTSHDLTPNSNELEQIIAGTTESMEIDNTLCIHIHSEGLGPLRGLAWLLITHHDKERIYAPVKTLRNRLISFTLAIGIFAVIMGFFMSSRITKPVEKLRAAAEKIGRGDLDTEINITSNDEVGRLAKTFRTMTESLQTATTARDKLTNDLMESREEFRALVETAHDAIISIDSRGIIIFWNSAAAQIFGYTSAESVNRSIDMIIPDKLIQAHKSGLNSVSDAGQRRSISTTTELTGLRKDGSELPIELSLAQMTVKGGQYFTAIIRDITERKKSDAAILEREETYRTLFEATSDAIFIISVDHEGRAVFIDCNQTTLSLFKFTRDEIIGMGPENISPPVQPDGCMSASRVAEVVKHTMNGTPQFFEWTHVRSDGTPFSAEVTLHRMEIRGEQFIQAIVRDISARKHSEDTIKLQLSRLNVLYSIEKAISSSPDLRTTLSHLIDQVMTHLKIDAASLLLMDKHSHMLEYEISKGFSSSALKYTKLKVGEGTAGRAAAERHTIIIPDLIKEPGGLAHSKHLADENFVTYFAVPLITRGEIMGVMELFHRSPLSNDPDWLEFVDTIANQAAIAIDNASLFDGLQRTNMDLVLAYDSTIYGLSRALDMRDKETEGHSQRVTEMTVRIAEHMGIKDADLVHIRRGALLHDIGKMGIPDNILLKPGKLTDTERETMQLHSVYGHEMLQDIDYLKPSLDIPLYHHERWDGAGYPKGLTGTDIPLSARIFAIVDVWDALSSDRPYRLAWSEEKVTEHILRQSGTHFDPEVVTVFFELMKTLRSKNQLAV